MAFRTDIATLLLVAFLLVFTGITKPVSSNNIPDLNGNDGSLVLEFSNEPLKLFRKQEELSLSQNQVLLPGDRMETSYMQFAVLRLSDGSGLIIHPLSRISLSDNGKKIILTDADIHFNYSGENSTPPEIDTIQCFGNRISVPFDGESLSFGVQCRAESGLVFSAQDGSMYLHSEEKSHKMNEGHALLGRTTSNDFMEVSIPARPQIIDSAHAQSPEIPESNESPIHFHWQDVSMTDHYLVHIHRQNSDEAKHLFHLQKANHFTPGQLSPGTYLLRVIAIDYYGVSGSWSEPQVFDISESID